MRQIDRELARLRGGARRRSGSFSERPTRPDGRGTAAQRWARDIVARFECSPTKAHLGNNVFLLEMRLLAENDSDWLPSPKQAARVIELHKAGVAVQRRRAAVAAGEVASGDEVEVLAS